MQFNIFFPLTQNKTHLNENILLYIFGGIFATSFIKYLVAIEAKSDFLINLLDTLHILHSAQNFVKTMITENYFRNMGFSEIINSLASLESLDIETEPTYNETFKDVSTLIHCPMISLNEYVTVYDDESYLQHIIFSQTKRFCRSFIFQMIPPMLILTTNLSTESRIQILYPLLPT